MIARIFLVVILSSICWAAVPHAQAPIVVYLAPYDGAGTDLDPFYIRGRDHETKCIGLRKDPTVAAGWAICGRATLPAGSGYVELASRLDGALTPKQQAALEASLEIVPKSATITDIVAELLIQHGKIDGTRWRPLRPTKEGKYEIYLTPGREKTWQQTSWLYPYIHDNGLVADATNATLQLLEPAMAWASSFTEDWNCANSASLTCDLTWTETTGTGWQILSNAATVANASTGVARADHDLATVDMETTATLSELTRSTASSVFVGVLGRKDSSTTRTYYHHVGVKNNVPSEYWELGYYVSGTGTVLDTLTQTINVGDVVKVRLNGSTISGLVNDIVVTGPVTDTTITSNTRAGITGGAPAAAAVVTLDLWSAVDYVSGTEFVPLRRRL